MECYTGFTVECKTNSDAEQVAMAMKGYLEKKGLSEHYLVKKINIWGSNVKQDEDFCTENFWGDTFEEMCRYVESKYPGMMIRGESYYSESTGMHSRVTFERSDEGISFHEVLDDYDTVVFMHEAGEKPETIAAMTGLSLKEVEAYIQGNEEFDEDDEDGEYMITIDCSPENREEIMSLLIDEFTIMLLRGVDKGLERIWDGKEPKYEHIEFVEVSREGDLFKKARNIVIENALLTPEITEFGVCADAVSSEEAGFVLVDKLFNKNSYIDEFGNKGATFKSVAERILEKYPDAEISGRFIIEGSSYCYTEVIETVDGRIKSRELEC